MVLILVIVIDVVMVCDLSGGGDYDCGGAIGHH
jgi:hypothetical protein